MNKNVLTPDYPIDAPREEIVQDLLASLVDAEQNRQDIQLYPIGFIRVPFTKSRLDEGYSMHIWDKDFPVRQPFFPLHTHINHLQSRIIYGEMRNKIWSVLDDTDGDYRLAEIIYTKDGSHKNDTDRRVSYELDSDESIPQDGIYEVALEQFHESIPQGNRVITLIRKSNFDFSNKLLNVVPIDKPKGEYGFDHRQFTNEDLWEHVHRVTEQLENEIASYG